MCLFSEKFKNCLTLIHRQQVTTPLHVDQGYKGQTVTLTLPTAGATGTFCFLIGSAARTKRFMDDLAGLLFCQDISSCFTSLLWKQSIVHWHMITRDACLRCTSWFCTL